MKKNPIFIHSLFRTGSTYLWNKFRQNDQYCCYYEPFYQNLSKVTCDNIETLMTKDFQSVNHPKITKFYLYEYKKHLEIKGSGVPYFKKSFSFDEFCDNEDNPDLKKYIDTLIEGAKNKIPVLQFNRSAFRVKWFKKNYPDSLNIYLVRQPRDQWKSYFDLYERTNFIDFFIMDLLIASINKDKEDFRLLSKILPLISYTNNQQDREIDFYRVVLDSYSNEDKYFIFYYMWFKAMIINVLHADFVLNINLFSKKLFHKEKIIKILNDWGIKGINFNDARIKEYSVYPLSIKTMSRIEDQIQKIIVASLNKNQIDFFFHNISQDNRNYFHFDKENFLQQKKDEFKQNVHEEKINKLKKMIFLFEDENQQIKTQISQMDYKIKKILNSHSYRIGKVIVSPVKVVKRLIPDFFRSISGFYLYITKLKMKHSQKYERKINLSNQLGAHFGKHRCGWKYVVQILRNVHNRKGILLDAFIERTFCWYSKEAKPYLEPWIGFIHVPHKVPDWFQFEQSNDVLFKSDVWKKSLPYCKGLFTLSYYHRKNLESKLDIPINNLIFPTETPKLKWSWQRFETNEKKKIVQIGWWLRKLHAIYQLPQTRYDKIFLNVGYGTLFYALEKEREILLKQGTFNDNMYKTAETIKYLSKKKFDNMLCENIAFVYLYDASASNVVIECIVRNTPLLINPIEAVVEYLGEDYPFYFTSLEEAAQKAEDFDLVYQTHNYLKKHAMKEKLKGEYFLKSFVESEIYSNL